MITEFKLFEVRINIEKYSDKGDVPEEVIFLRDILRDVIKSIYLPEYADIVHINKDSLQNFTICFNVSSIYFNFNTQYKNDKFIVEAEFSINRYAILISKLDDLAKKFDTFSDDTNEDNTWIFDTDSFIENMKMLDNTEKYNL